MHLQEVLLDQLQIPFAAIAESFTTSTSGITSSVAMNLSVFGP